MHHVFLELAKYNYSVTSESNFMENNLIDCFHSDVHLSIFFDRYYIQNRMVLERGVYWIGSTSGTLFENLTKWNGANYRC